MAKKKKEESLLDKLKNTVSNATNSVKDTISDLFDGDNKKSTPSKSTSSSAKNTTKKINTTNTSSAKNISVPRPTTTLNNATKKVLSTPKITPKSTVKKPTSTATKTPTIKSSSLPNVSSNPKVQKMAENSTQWNRLEAQKNLLLKQNPKQNVSALTNKQNLLHKKNTDLGLDLGLKFTPSGSWTNSSGNKAYDVGTTKNGYISPVSPLALLTQLNSAMPKSTQQIAAEGQARQFNAINDAASESLKNAGNWLLHNTAAGAAGFASSITNTVDMVLPDSVTPSFLQSYFDHNRKTNEEWQEISGSTNSKGGTASEIAGTVYQAGVQAVPTALAAIASGGSSLASQLGQAGNAVSNLITSLPFWTSFAQTAGNEYFNALENGANELQASLTGMASGAVGGAIERMGGIDTLLGNKTQGILRTAAEEAGEEVLQDITSGLINKASYDTGREWFGTGDSDAVINPQRLAMNATAGAILGGAASGVNAVIGHANNTIANTKQSVNDIEVPTLKTVAENHINKSIANAQNAQNASLLSNQPLQNNTSVNVENVTSIKPLQVPTLRTVAENHIAETMAKAQNVNNPGTLKQGVWQEGEVKPKLKPEYETRPEPKLPMTPEEQNILEMQLDAFEKANNILPLPGFNPETQTFEQTETVGQIIDNAIADAQNTKKTTNSNTAVDTQQDVDVANILSAWDTVREFDKQIADFENRVSFTQRDLKKIKAALLADDKSIVSTADNPQDALYMVELKSLRNNAYKPISDYNQANSSERNIQAMEWADYIAQYATDKAGWQYFLETPERNIYDIFGKNNRHLAQQFIDTFLTPVHKDVAKRNKIANDYRSRVKKLKLNKHESAIVQYMIENEVAGANKYITDNKIKMTAEKTAKIDNAVTEFRVIYKELLDKINTALIRNGYEPVQSLGDFYAPHFIEKLSDRKLARLAYWLKIKITKKDQLPTDLAGVTEMNRPGKKWSGNLEHRKGTKTIYDAVRGFDQYIETVSDVIALTDSIQRLRSLEDAVRYRLSDEGTQMEIDAVKNDIELNALQKREKIEGIYSQEQTHIEKIKQLLSQKDAGMRNFVTELRRYTDSLAGKKSRGDRGIEDIIGREVYEISKQVQNRITLDLLGANIAAASTNFIPLTQATGEIEMPYLIKGMYDTLKNLAKDDGFIDASTFLTNRIGSKPINQSFGQKFINKSMWGMEAIDYIVSNTIVRAKTNQNIQNGMDLDSAIDEADSFAASLMADRSKGAMPAVFEIQNPLIKPFTMFQLEVNNQLRYLGKDIPRRLGEQGGQAIAAALTNIFFMSFIGNEVFEKLMGRRPAFDPAGIIKNAMNVYYDVSKNTSDKIEQITTPFVQQLPFVGGMLDGGRVPISAVFPKFPNLWEGFNSELAPEKRKDLIMTELSKPFFSFVLPVGGNAIKRGIEGFNMIRNGGEYRLNDNGEEQLMFAAPGDTPNDYLKAMLFGKYSNENGQNYINNGFQVLSPEYTQKYKKLISDEYGIDNNTAYDALMAVANAPSDEKRTVLMNTPLPADAKSYLDWTLFSYADSGNRIDYSDKDHFNITTQIDSDFLDNALYLYDNLGLKADEVINLIKTSSFESINQVGSKKDQIFNILNNIYELNLSDDLKDYAYTEILAPQISEKFTTEQGKQLLEGVPMREAIRSYYMRDIINEEIDNDNTIHPLDKKDYRTLGWQNYLAENALEENMTFEQREKLRYFLANGQSEFEKTWDDYVYGGNEKERENIESLRNCGLDTLTYQVIKSGISDFKADKDANGEPIDDSKKNKVSAYFKQWNLTDEQYALMMKLQGYKVGSSSSSSSKKSSSKKSSSKSSNSSPKVKGGFSDFKGF